MTDRMNVIPVTEFYCSNCGQTKVVKIEKVDDYTECAFCGSDEINEA